MEENGKMTYEKVLSIMGSYSKTGADHAELGQLYENLLLTIPSSLSNKEEERTKEEEIKKKILALIVGKEDKEKNLIEDVRGWIIGQTGDWNIVQMYFDLELKTKQQKDTARQIVHRLCKSNFIEHIGKRAGWYRRIVIDFELQKWWEEEDSALPIRFPLAVERYAKVFKGNIILLEGQKSQGKSMFSLEFARLNRKLFKTKPLYQNVEMSNSELSQRFKKYSPDVMSMDEWINEIEFTRRTENWWDLIRPDGLNIVDYLIEYEEAFRIADFVWRIHKKLRDGIALVVIQRDPLKPYPPGGRGVRDIPRLILSLIYHKLKLEDVKSFQDGIEHNPTGMMRGYKQVEWWKFIPTTDWITEEAMKEKKQEEDLLKQGFTHED